jgi:hypothetical protein
MYTHLVKLIQSFACLEDLVPELEYSGLYVEDIIIDGESMLFVSQKDSKVSTGFEDFVYDETSMALIDKKLDIKMIALKKMELILDLSASTAFDLNKYGQICIEQWFVGQQVAVSFHNGRVLISTEDDPFGANVIPGTKDTTYHDFVIDELKKANKMYGVNALNEASETPTTWIFTVVPKVSENTTSLKHELILVACINMELLKEVSKDQLWTLGNSIHINTPRYQLIKHINEVNPTVGSLISSKRAVRGIITSGVEGLSKSKKEINYGEGAEYIIRANYGKIKAIANCILENEREKAFEVAPECNDLVYTMCNKFDHYLIGINELFRHNQHLRTKKHFALKVGSHPMASILYDMREGCAINSAYIHSNFKAHHLIEMIMKNDSESFLKSVNRCREKLCQKER